MFFDFACRPQPASRQAIDALLRAPEADTILALCAAARLPETAQRTVSQRALTLIARVRSQRTRSSGVDALMREFSLSSDEGVALMCLAEALLRIPDASTRDALIRDKIGGGDWHAHLGRSPSLFVNAASWGLLLTGKLVTTHSQDNLGAALKRLVSKGGEPVIRRAVDLAMRMLGRQFVTGETIEEALKNGAPNLERGYRYSYDMLGEAALTAADASRYLSAYEHAIDRIGQSVADGQRGVRRGPGISIKLSALHPRYQRAQRERVMRELLPVITALAQRAARYDIGLNIDAEEADRLDLSLDLLEALAAEPALKSWAGLGFVVQAYSKRAPAVLDWIIALARREQRQLMVRLVKGAYWDSEIKRAQIEGQRDYPVYTRKSHTDVAYQACARKLLAATDVIYPQFATHNAYTLAWVREAAALAAVPADGFEFQCLHGMGETLYDQVLGEAAGFACRIYAPVGSHETLLAYLVRRLLENGANSSFVNRIVDESIPLDALAADPVLDVEAHRGQMHPRIPLPRDLYAPMRQNSAGIDAAHEGELAALQHGLNQFATTRWQAAPATGSSSAPARAIINPADRADTVGLCVSATPADVDAAVIRAQGAAAAWAALPGAARAATLERIADALESARIELIALLMREAGKSLINAVGEIREAADFCRYYAAQARAAAPLGARAPLVCISPWNFPLAIFTGQIVAALAAGRSVLAKPAEQTPLVAARAVALMHAAGVPEHVLNLLPGDGESVGAPLVAHAHIGGVLFTGSTAVARQIARTLAARDDDPVLVAETGGVNAMIVDSSALTEQVVQDVLASAFDSAGQRCSALRVLCVQADAHATTLAMLYGAFAELRLGNPARYSHDVGPVIDAEARERLEQHIASMQARGFKVTRLACHEDVSAGHFVAPAIIEIERIADLPGEVFGPVLHVMSYPAEALDALIDDINATGFGLTMGVHSRIDEHIARVAERAHVGNLYVNRNMIGAVVGVQPFGGEGLSGTGPKAGGPLYLARLGVPLAALPGAPAGRNAALTRLGRRIAQSGLSAEHQERLKALIARLGELAGEREPLALEGPTGESNVLRLVARTRLLCVAAEPADIARCAAVALAVGAQPMAQADLIDAALVEDIAALDAQMRADAVLLAGAADEHAWRQRLLADEGPLVPVLRLPASDDAIDASLLARLLHERSISTNTAAAGGNAALMVLGDD